MKTNNGPKNKQGFDRHRARLLAPSLLHGIDALFLMECEVLLHCYHGGYIRAGLHLVGRGIRAAVTGAYWNAVYRIGDRLGWTQLRPIPGTPYFERHGGQCDKMNCQDVDCVRRGLPRWWQKLTGMERDS